MVRCESKPLPLPFRIVPVHRVDYDWDAYCRKMGRPDLAKRIPTGGGGQGSAGSSEPQNVQKLTAADLEPNHPATQHPIDHTALTTLPGQPVWMVNAILDELLKKIAGEGDIDFLEKCRKGDGKNPFHPQLGGTWIKLGYTPKEINGLVTTRLNTYGYYPGNVNESKEMAAKEAEREIRDKEKAKEQENEVAAQALARTAASKAKAAPTGMGVPVPKGDTPTVNAPPNT